MVCTQATSAEATQQLARLLEMSIIHQLAHYSFSLSALARASYAEIEKEGCPLTQF